MTQRIERHRPKSANDPLNQAAFAWRSAYNAACKHDGMPEGTQYAVFSDANPFAKFVDLAAKRFWACQREYETGGYVGLQIKGGRAR
jgi:hypothetical protein